MCQKLLDLVKAFERYLSKNVRWAHFLAPTVYIHISQKQQSNLFSKCMTASSLCTDTMWQCARIWTCSVWTEAWTTGVRLGLCLALMCVWRNVKFWPLWDNTSGLHKIGSISIISVNHITLTHIDYIRPMDGTDTEKACNVVGFEKRGQTMSSVTWLDYGKSEYGGNYECLAL